MLLPIQIFYDKYRTYFLIVGIFGVYVGGMITCYWFMDTSRKLEEAQELKEAVDAKEKAEKLYYAKSVAYEELAAEKKIIENDIQKKVRNEIKADDSYKRDVSSNGLRLRADAISATNSRKLKNSMR